MPDHLVRSQQTPFNLFKIYKEIWRYKSFMLNWTKRELEMRYKGSVFGILWNFLNPLLSLAIYFFVFSRLSRVEVPNYLVFLFSGIIAWFFFTQVISRAPELLISSGGVLRKVYFPQEILVIAVVISGAVNYLVSFGLVLILMFLTKAAFTWNLLWVPLIVALQSLFMYSTSLLIASLGAVIRDLNQIIPTLLGLFFFLTPIVYSAETISRRFAWLLNSQPIANFISLYRDVIHEGTHPDWHLLMFGIIFNLLWYLFCHWVFHKLRYVIYDLI
jgi:lipopolysaccharide transport system permease protein